jgi:hypothetical protein
MAPVLLGALMAVQGWLWNGRVAVFVENLQQTEGVVVKVPPEGGWVEVEYQDEAGALYRKSLEVASGVERQLRAVDKVTLVYDRRTPQAAEIGTVVSAHNERLFSGALAGAGVLLMAGGLALAGWRVLEILGTLALFRSGQVVATEVRDVATVPGKTMGRFTYAFRGPNGRWFEGKSPELAAERLAEWPVGRKVLVAFDPVQAKRNEVDLFGLIDAAKRAEIQAA